MSAISTDLNSAGNSAATSSCTSKQSFEILETFPFYDGHPQVFAKIDTLLAETFGEISSIETESCQSSADTDEDLPWYRQRDVLVLDDCITVHPESRKPSRPPQFDAVEEEAIEEEECEVFPDFDIPLLETMIPLPIPEDLVKDLCFTETLMICHKDL
jgi:hypothetical protein